MDETNTIPDQHETIESRVRIVSQDSGRAPIGDEAAAMDVAEAGALPESPWWRVADFGVFGLWIAIVAYILPYHEKWADEAQAWLIARDLDLKTIWFHELRYEGSPGLWHTILWVAQHVFHAKYDSIGKIGAVCAAAGVALLIFKAPFPRYIRWPLAFTYFMIYQYAVIARPYTLLPLLAFAAALLFKDLKHPERMTVVLVLLANLSLHGTILAGCLGLVYLIDAFRAWSTLDASVRRRYWICIGVMAATFVFVVVILKPTPDVGEFAKKKTMDALPASIQAMQPTIPRKLEATISGAFLDYWLPSAVFVLFAGWWCFLRRRLLLFALPVLLLTCLYSLIHGYAHHHGTLLVSAVTALWVGWPAKEERRGLSNLESRALQGMTGLLFCLCVLNIWDAEVAIRHEYLYPYSGAEDAANYLRFAGADHQRIFGFLYGVVGVQAYFDHNILVNIPTAYYHHGLPYHGLELKEDEFTGYDPDYVVVFTEQPQLSMEKGIPELRALRYEIVHMSDGYMIYKQGVYVRQFYFILRKTTP